MTSSGGTGTNGGTWKRWFVTLGGSGMSPVAPGTMGSLAATALLAGIIWIFRRTHAPLSPITWNAILLAGILLYGALCVALGQWATQYYGRKDPGACVLDEGAGICLTALFVPLYADRRELWALLAIFIAFRIFDILKPPPARQLERLPYGWGILLDDLAAAVYANIACQLILRFAFGS
jgi:phosphatidylglycerophosphatase A